MSIYFARQFTLLAVLTGLLGIGLCSYVKADVISIETDTTWRATASVPATGWNTNLNFVENGFTNAVQNRIQLVNGNNVVGLWHSSGAPQVWFRKAFTLSGNPNNGTLDIVVDDDLEFYINGQLVVQNADTFPDFLYNINVTSLLHSGQNLIAVHAINRDNSTGLGDRTLAVKLDIDASPPTVAEITGRITLQNAVNQVQPITFEFRPNDGSDTFSRTVILNADRTFRLSNVPRKVYQIHIKGAKWLAKNVAVDTTSGDISNVITTLRGGDANNDNAVDIADLLLLINAYNQVSPASNYSQGADFNCDDSNDISDLFMLIGNYNQIGD